MKFSLDWLKAFLETEADAATVAATLNAIGIEVEGIDDPALKLAGFVVAEVLSAATHPQADKLQVLMVSTGPDHNGGAPLQVVCGAPNARAGMKGVLGLPGAVVPGNGMALRQSAIRGVESNGMMCSVRELELGDEHDGIIELPIDAPVGADFATYHGTSPVFDVAITPNRPDCMGVEGIARDLAAAGLGTFKPWRAAPVAGSFPCPVEIRSDDPAGCPAFYGRVIRGVRNGVSPAWMQARLIAAGQRPISALVDITNYLSLGFGRPAHVYDLAKLSGAIVARRARDGEQVEALNDKRYTLTPEMTVIADAVMVHDIAGIMGGAHSAVTADTTDVLIEVAYFDPARISATGRRLGLSSDARARFERGVDPAFLDAGIDLLTDLIVRICGGEPSEVVRAGHAPSEPRVIAFDPALAERLGGVAIAPEEQRRILEALDFAISPDWRVTVPLRRHDIAGAPDLVEEVVRIHGLDRVASVALPRRDGVARPTATPAQAQERRVRRAAAALGMHEAITWSFLPEADAAQFVVGEAQDERDNGGLWVLDNPISEDMKAMRPSLLPGLLRGAQRNLDRGTPSLRLFEIGRRYLRGDERATLGLILAGERSARGWDGRDNGGRPRAFDAFDAKAAALSLLGEAGAPGASLSIAGDAGAQFHPGQSGTLRLGPKTVLARFGMLHPALLQHFGITAPVAAAELFLDAIPARKAAGFARPAFAPPAQQRVTRDFALVVDAALPAGDLLRAVKGADKQAIMAARVFDVFAGPGVPEGRKSVGLEVTLQPGDKSFTDAAIKALSDRIVAAAGKLGAALRG